MPLARSVLFSATARFLAAEAQQRGLVAPGFRCPPRAPGVARAIRRLPDGSAVVAVRVRGRQHGDVVVDMVDGVIAANGLSGEEAVRVRAELLAAAGEMAEPAGSEAA